MLLYNFSEILFFQQQNVIYQTKKSFFLGQRGIPLLVWRMTQCSKYPVTFNFRRHHELFFLQHNPLLNFFMSRLVIWKTSVSLHNFLKQVLDLIKQVLTFQQCLKTSENCPMCNASSSIGQLSCNTCNAQLYYDIRCI